MGYGGITVWREHSSVFARNNMKSEVRIRSPMQSTQEKSNKRSAREYHQWRSNPHPLRSMITNVATKATSAGWVASVASAAPHPGHVQPTYDRDATQHKISFYEKMWEERSMDSPSARGVYACGVYNANLKFEFGENIPGARVAVGPRSSHIVSVYDATASGMLGFACWYEYTSQMTSVAVPSITPSVGPTG